MTDTATPDVQDEAQALESARAGYGRKARANAVAESAPAVAPAMTEAVEQPTAVVSAEPGQETAAASIEPAHDPEPAALTQPSDTDQLRTSLDDLKAQVNAIAANGVDRDTVRKMHGEIGEINRYIKQLSVAKPEDAPATETKLAAALKRAEETASLYPEIGGPLLDALREMAAMIPETPPPAKPEKVEPPAQVAAPAAPAIDLEAEAQKRIVQKAREDLLEIHADYYSVRNSAEFNKWFATKPTEYQKKALSSWNPVVVAEPVTSFKAWQAAQREARRTKQDRLEAAVQPTGLQQSGTPSVLPDEAGFARGYARRARRA